MADIIGYSAIIEFMRRISWRTWLSILTLVIVAVVLYTARQELAHAWRLLHEVDLVVLLSLLVPLQFLSYYAMGETLFSYLRSQGQAKKISTFGFARLTLEMNFVNHVLPSAGMSGISYMGWRLRHFGVSLTKSTTAQLVRIVATFGGYAIVLAIAVLFMLADGSLNRWISLTTAVLVAAIFGMIIGMVYILENTRNLPKIARLLVRFANACIKILSFGKQPKKFPSAQPTIDFLLEVRKDYQHIRANKKVLHVPMLWGILFCIVEVGMFYSSFLALGYPINPAPLVVAYGLAGAAAIFMVTPGGAGVYEFVMIGFLVAVGVDPRAGIAAIVLVRALLMVGTIIAGYYFYQQAIIKHGKRPDSAA